MSSTFQVIQGFYKSILEKQAEDASITPDYGKDNREIALGEVEKNKKDQREQLGTLLRAAKEESKVDTKELKETYPKASKEEDTVASNPLVKIASNRAFFNGLRQTDILKTASPDFMRAVFASFNDEAEKIAASLWGKALGEAGSAMTHAAPKAMPGALKATAKAAPMAAAAKAAPSAWKPGTVVSGQSLVGGGVPGMHGSSVTFPK